ncbi:hypothetical protein [Alicyclobacillus pomorum]|jgi:hypothetical protein|uniref:hypothetical protein n=1 Tax=Alicyclobacillus pomorum TaxID=204470 RepID=UPI00047D118F|nr:hypothetical protein [Alicyclobacillus pomorum]
MESMYLSLVSCVLTLCTPARQKDTSQQDGERAVRLATLVYVASLATYFVRPSLGLHPVSVTFACAWFALLFLPHPSAVRSVQTLGAGLVIAMVTMKFVALFPFHQWHRIPTSLLVGGLWLVLSSVLAGGVQSARSAVTSAYIWIYLASSTVHEPALFSPFLSNISLADLQPWACNAFWFALFCCQLAHYTVSSARKVWETRYKPVI